MGMRLAALAAMLLGGILLITILHSAPSQFSEPEEGFDSPRLAALARQLEAGDRAALDRFYAELEGKAPLVEPTVDDPHASWVTFVWRAGGGTRRVNLGGGPSRNDFAAWLKRLGDTDLWYRTERIRSDARFAYFFQVNRPLRFPPDADKRPPLAPPLRDPLNPHPIATREGSLLELSEAPPQPWLERHPQVPAGRLSEHKIRSAILDQERSLTVYTPPSYDPSGADHGLLVTLDGPAFRSSDEIPGPVILDNLLAERKVPPLVAVFLDQKDRTVELGCSETFADFAARELIPWVRTNYRISADPARTIICGLSRGGLMASCCAFRHSEVFGNVLALSGSFQWWPGADIGRLDEEPGRLTRQFLSAPILPVRFYLAAGSFEHDWPFSLLAENRRFRDVLLAKGYAVQYQEFSGGHDPVGWRGPFVDGLIALTGGAKR